VNVGIPAVLADQRIVVVDIEGNGRQPPEIIEIAALPVEHDLDPTCLRSWLVRPGAPILPLVTAKVHGISNAQVVGCPAWPEIAGAVEHVLRDRVLVAHNASVEYRVLSRHLPSWHPPLVLDTLRLAKHVWPDIPSYSLHTLIQHRGLDTNGVGQRQPHRAAYDTWCTARLLCALAQDSPMSWTALAVVAALPGAATPPAEQQGGLW
jgi:DNA polymerase III epsilon subunit-like protein